MKVRTAQDTLKTCGVVIFTEGRSNDSLVKFIVTGQYEIPRFIMLPKDDIISEFLFHKKKEQHRLVIQIL